MKRLFAIVVAMLAMSAFFTSCDEENFVISHTTVTNSADSLKYEVWCDQSNALTSYSIKWLIIRQNGSMQYYNCSVYKDEEGQPACNIDPMYGSWSVKDNYMMLDFPQTETMSASTITLRYDDLDGRTVLRPIEATTDTEFFEYANASRQSSANAEMWQDIMTLFKYSRNIEDNLDIATEYVLSSALESAGLK